MRLTPISSFAALSAGLFCAVPVAGMFMKEPPFAGMCGGAVLAVANAAAAALLNGATVGGSGRRTIGWIAAGNVLRLAVVLGILTCAGTLMTSGFFPFAMTFIAGYSIFLIREILILHVKGLKGGSCSD